MSMRWVDERMTRMIRCTKMKRGCLFSGRDEIAGLACEALQPLPSIYPEFKDIARDGGPERSIPDTKLECFVGLR